MRAVAAGIDFGICIDRGDVMDLIRHWLLSIVCTAFLVSLIDRLSPDGAIRQLIRFGGGLVLLLCVLQPLGEADITEYLPDISALSAEKSALEEYYREESKSDLSAVIAARAGEYIEDKARALGFEVTAEVSVQEEDGRIVPYSAVLYGTKDKTLTELLACELDIPLERQEWREVM